MKVAEKDETSSATILVLVYLNFQVSQVDGTRVSLLWKGAPRRDVSEEIGYMFGMWANGILY